MGQYVHQERPLFACDTECWHDYWSIGFTSIDDPSIQYEFIQTPWQRLDTAGVAEILSRVTIVTFNGVNYDDQMITLALYGADNKTLKAANDLIIVGHMKPWVFYDHYGIRPLEYMDSIDLMEPAPGVKVSLKIYGGRCNSKRLQDLVIAPDQAVRPDQYALVSWYRKNDEITTRDLYLEIKDRIDLRIDLSKKYGIDLRSKSDAQIAESLIKHLLGYNNGAPYWAHGTEFYYKPLSFLNFKTAQLQSAYSTILTSAFKTSDKDQVLEETDEDGNKIKTGIIIPKAIKDMRIVIGATTYKFGYGGLHSQEHASCHHSTPGICEITDHDVTSYYPRIILNQRLYPSQLGEGFLTVYDGFVEERIDAKPRHKYYKKMRDSGDASYDWQYWYKHFLIVDEGFKIVINGSFGKFGSKYSALFSPDLMVQVTISGQLCLLLLIETLELCGISVVSANTDGIVVKCPDGMQWLRDRIINEWETITRFNTECTHYEHIWSRDVNNYIAVKPDGEIKLKGIFAKAGIRKSPNNSICVDAVIKYLVDGISIEQTIKQCTDIRRFLTIRHVAGGAIKNNVELGKAVRWYYGINEKGIIAYIKNSNKVPRSEGAVPLMELPDYLPGDIDYDWYIKEANGMLTEIGAY